MYKHMYGDFTKEEKKASTKVPFVVRQRKGMVCCMMM